MAATHTISPLTEQVTDLPPSRRYICTHDSSGKSVLYSQPSQKYHGRSGVGGMARSYAVSSVPAVLKDNVDIQDYEATSGVTSYLGTEIVSPNQKGANLLVVDIAPGGQTQMHRTVSIDFSICVLGHIKMELDGGGSS